RRATDHLDPLREAGVHRRAVLVAPRVVLEPAAVLEHQYARTREPPDDRLADLLSGGERVDPRERAQRVGEGPALLAPQAVLGEGLRRERRQSGGERRAGGRDGDRLDPDRGSG